MRRRSVHPEPSADANADANWESEPVGCCRSDGPERIQETVPDGASQAPYAFWKCGIPRQAVSRVRIPLAPRFAYSIRDLASRGDRNLVDMRRQFRPLKMARVNGRLSAYAALRRPRLRCSGGRRPFRSSAWRIRIESISPRRVVRSLQATAPSTRPHSPRTGCRCGCTCAASSPSGGRSGP